MGSEAKNEPKASRGTESTDVNPLRQGGGLCATEDGLALAMEGAVKAHEDVGSQVSSAILRRYRMLFEHATDGVWIATQSGRFLAVNPAGCRILGYDLEHHLKLQVTDLIRAEELPRLEQLKERLAAGEEVADLWEARCADGSSVPLELHHSFTSDGLWQAIGRKLSRDERGQAVRLFAALDQVAQLSLAEQRLKVSEERFQKLFQLAPIGIAIRDLDGRFERCNPAHCRMIGYSEEELHMRHFAQFVHPEDRDTNLAELQRLIDHQIPYLELENRYIHKDGRPIWVHKFVCFLPDAEGRSAHIVSFAIDITERIRAKQQLHASERLYRATFDNAAIGIANVALDGRWLRFNNAVCKITGYSREELGRRTFGDITHPEDLKADWDRAREIIAGRSKSYTLEKRYIRPDGSTVWVNLTVSGVWDDYNSLVHFVSIIEDITPRKRSEEALRAADERFRTMADTAPVLIWETDDTGVVYVNGHYLEFFGVDFAAVRGMGWSKFMHPEDAPAYETVWREATARRESYTCQCRFLRADGQYRWLQNTGHPVGAERFVGCSVDITDLQNARLQAYEREQALRAADRQKDDFLAMLAHELRNPLAGISNAGAILAHLAAGENRAERSIAVLRRQTTQLTRLVDDLLDTARIARGRVKLDKQPIDIGMVVDQAVELIQPLMREKRHRLTVKKQQPDVYVLGDQARLVQAISNVLHNAAKYTDSGGEIRVEVCTLDHEIAISIRDTGAGIAPEVLPHVFEIFVQSERTLDRSQGGLGIGLSVVKGLIEMQGGSVSVHSEGLARGSQFTILLPRIPTPPPTSPMLSATPPRIARRVLIVEDNTDAADSLRLLLELEHHEVHVAYGSYEALEAVRRLNPDIVLLDIGLPSLDGYEVVRRIRTLTQDGPRPKVIALTGYGQTEDRERAIEAGFDGHLLKPIDPGTLGGLIAASLASSEEH